MYGESDLKTLPVGSTKEVYRAERSGLLWTLLLLLAVLSGCATAPTTAGRRVFDFDTDTFAYTNELVWAYEYDANGKWTTRQREPKPTYAQHCFVVARSALQFLNNTRFAPELPIADEKTYRRLVRKVVATNLRRTLAEEDKIVIPGYANLRQFSEAQETLLKEESGGAWQSYFQRGHWRMIFPFSRRHQQEAAEELLQKAHQGRPAVLHVVRFPDLTINHAVLLYGAEESENGIIFSIYDPNRPSDPAFLNYDKVQRTFYLPANLYFKGGEVDVYEIYRGLCY